MFKLSKKILFVLFVTLASLFGIILTFQIKEYHPDNGSIIKQFNLSLLGLSLTIFIMFYYLQALNRKR